MLSEMIRHAVCGGGLAQGYRQVLPALLRQGLSSSRRRSTPHSRQRLLPFASGRYTRAAQCNTGQSVLARRCGGRLRACQIGVGEALRDKLVAEDARLLEAS